MSWQPISETGIWERILSAESRMNAEQQRLWDAIKLPPQKWMQALYGNSGGGFWAVAIFGQFVVWFNDIEDGFNVSCYKSFGTIENYLCNQDELETTLQSILNLIQHGYSLPACSAPIAGEHPNRP